LLSLIEPCITAAWPLPPAWLASITPVPTPVNDTVPEPSIERAAFGLAESMLNVTGCPDVLWPWACRSRQRLRGSAASR